MPDLDNLPHLEILPVENLILHEYNDHQRTPPIIRSIEEDGLLRNPPVVLPFQDNSGRFMVLDGANRVSALQDMGVPHTIAQIVHVGDPGLKLTSWNHLVWGVSPDTLIDWFRALPELNLYGNDDRNLPRNVLDDGSLAMLQLSDGRIFSISTQESNLIDRVKVLNKLVDCYAQRTNLDRTMSSSIEPLKGLYTEFSGLVLLPSFQIEDVLYLGTHGHLMPKGITRFVISGRALHVNIPLGFLFNSQSLDEKRAWLQEWLQDRFSRKAVRYYAEPIFMFDE